MAQHHKILGHPAHDQIVSWLLAGVSVRDVEHRLAQMYPGEDEAHLRPSFSSIQLFRKQYLNIEDKVLSDIKEAQALTKEALRKEAIQAELEKSTAYRDKINAIVDDKLDVQKELIKAFSIIESRIEAIYNQATLGTITDVKLERVLLGYIEQLRALLPDYAKLVNGFQETTNHNINVSIVSDQVHIIRDAVREVLADIDPSLSVRFMEKLTGRLRNLSWQEQDYDGMLLDRKSEGVNENH